MVKILIMWKASNIVNHNKIDIDKTSSDNKSALSLSINNPEQHLIFDELIKRGAHFTIFDALARQDCQLVNKVLGACNDLHVQVKHFIDIIVGCRAGNN